MSNNKPLSANISNLTSNCALNIKDDIFNCLKNLIIRYNTRCEYS